MWRIDGERTFNTKSASDVADRETSCRACAACPSNYNTNERLNSRALSFSDSIVHLNSIASPELRNIAVLFYFNQMVGIHENPLDVSGFDYNLSILHDADMTGKNYFGGNKNHNNMCQFPYTPNFIDWNYY
tara:strand:- start:88 stop:480 length:393 start_codon:yes stop_codon:yes gene_type:complete